MFRQRGSQLDQCRRINRSVRTRRRSRGLQFALSRAAIPTRLFSRDYHQGHGPALLLAQKVLSHSSHSLSDEQADPGSS